MSGQWNSETQRYEVYSTLEGGMVPTGSDRGFYNLHDDPEYCGSCKTTPCLVNSGKVCCHNMVRYGYCQHEPLEQEEAYTDTSYDDDIYIDEEAPEPQYEAPREQRQLRMPRPPRPYGERPQRPRY